VNVILEYPLDSVKSGILGILIFDENLLFLGILSRYFCIFRLEIGFLKNIKILVDISFIFVI